MPITNVNMFQQGINHEEFLTKYTDQYLKQALANLGQRFSVKGDSIVSGSFKIKDLFPKYVGEWNDKGLCVNVTTRINEGIFSLDAQLMKWDSWVDPATKKEYKRFVNISDGSDSSQYTFKIDTVNDAIEDVEAAGFEDNIALENGLQINNTAYWSNKDAVIIKKNDSYLYKLEAFAEPVSKLSESYEPEEGLIEYVSNDGQLLDSLRIVVDKDVAVLEDSSDTDTSKECTYLFHLYYDNKTNPDNPTYRLEVFNLNLRGNWTIESDYSIPAISEFYKILLGEGNTSMNLNRYSTVEDILNEMALSDDWDISKPIVNLVVDYDNEKNQRYSIKNYSGVLDKDFVENKLNYFSHDEADLFPRIREVFNEIKYEAEDNIKIYGEILGHLLMTEVYYEVFNQYTVNDEFGDALDNYVVTFPVDYEISYNVNSSNPAIIYNSINSVNIQYIANTISNSTVDNLGLLDFKTEDTDVIEYIDQVSNNSFELDGTPININNAIVHAYETKTVLYQFVINYIDDNIINSILWFQTFSLPYVNSDGYWNINGIDTNIYAYGKDSQKTNFVIVQSELNDEKFLLNDHTDKAEIVGTLISDPYDINSIITNNWTSKLIKMPYLVGADTDTIDDTNYYYLQAYLPDEDYLNKITETNQFSYIQNTIFINLLSPTTEYDTWRITDIQRDKIEGYEPYYPADEEIQMWAKYEPRSGTLASKIGTKGVLTSFWSLQFNEEKSKYEFSYLKRPGAQGLGLDMTYMCNLDNITKYYISTEMEPDKYEHRWLVFNTTANQYKNNTTSISDAEEFETWPVLMPHPAEYYAEDYGTVFQDPPEMVDVTKVPGVFLNEMNFSLQFYNDVRKDENQMINYVGQKPAEDTNPYFRLTHKDTSYNIANEPDRFFMYPESSAYFKENAITRIDRDIYCVSDIIPYAKYPLEFVPNAWTDYEGIKDQYPTFNLAEVLLKDVNTLNRYNILTVGKMEYLDKEIYPLYYSYIGTAFDNEDKARLHIGSSEINPNLGTKTMVSEVEEERKVTPVEVLDIDMKETNINGDVNLNGNVNVNSTIWRVTEIPTDKEPLKVFSTIITPVGDWEEVNNNSLTYPKIDLNGSASFIGNQGDLTDPNSPAYASAYGNYQRYAEHPSSEALFSTINFNLGGNTLKTSKSTRYYHEENEVRKVSYINLTKLFKDNNIFQNTYFSVASNAPLTYHTYLEHQNAYAGKEKGYGFTYTTSYYMQLSTDMSDKENNLLDAGGILVNVDEDNNNEIATIEKAIKVGNPIQISYYNGKMPAITYIDKVTYYLSYLWPVSYTESWTCSGCDLCSYVVEINSGDEIAYSSYTCGLMKSFRHAKCEVFVTYEYGLIEEDKKETLKPKAFELDRTVTLYDENGASVTYPTKDTIYFPNPKSVWKNTTYSLTDEEGRIKWTYMENGTWIPPFDGTNPGPKYAYIFSGSITFESSYEMMVAKLNKATKNSSYWVETKENPKYNSNATEDSPAIEKVPHTYVIAYITATDDPYDGEDAVENREKHYVYYQYKTKKQEGNHHELWNSKDNKNIELEVIEYIDEYVTIPVEYSFENKETLVPTPTTINSYIVNVREVLSTHTDPYYYTAVASLNRTENNTDTKGTNKYQ